MIKIIFRNIENWVKTRKGKKEGNETLLFSPTNSLPKNFIIQSIQFLIARQ